HAPSGGTARPAGSGRWRRPGGSVGPDRTGRWRRPDGSVGSAGRVGEVDRAARPGSTGETPSLSSPAAGGSGTMAGMGMSEPDLRIDVVPHDSAGELLTL